ncbi:LUD domain-containing protein [Streptomyces sp. CB01881]|uniref:LutC/YkgG family protein n=1 Tax=Streptomyces sp. CB01881 TaxID=2078691 RepID=UPI000CDC07EF|nr:LUD domain-containing protein [Streptomyces sp. CB01881]AUY48122.1 lactate utilization protein C [Streptomyces sp. CB01881]TYC76609.1 lactate utilization protein C [Streptomyces sp. CB01881]
MTTHRPPGSRELVLGRIRAALGTGRPATGDRYAAPAPDEQPLPRDYLASHAPADDPAALLDLLHHNLADYRAEVHRCPSAGLPALVAALLAARGSRSVAVPADLPPAWLSAATAVEARPDDGTLTAARLDRTDSVLTGCALAIAETGTLVLDAGPAQGRRLLTLVPDHHICVVLAPGQVVASVPLALPRLDPARPQTWISGPSATSDIELDRVEGVHGPRTLEVVLVTPD